MARSLGMDARPYDLVDGPYEAPSKKLTGLTLNGWGYRWIRPSRSDQTLVGPYQLGLMRIWLRDHGLLIANLLLFVIFFGGMVFSGVRVYNSEQLEHGEQAVSLGRYYSLAPSTRRPSRTGKANSSRWGCTSC